MEHKTIPLDAVRNALMCAVVKQKTAGRDITGKPMARFAASTNYQSFSHCTCRNASWGRRVQYTPCHFGPMSVGDLSILVRNVHLFHGAPEVRKTWGVGLRAMQTDIESGVMR